MMKILLLVRKMKVIFNYRKSTKETKNYRNSRAFNYVVRKKMVDKAKKMLNEKDENKKSTSVEAQTTDIIVDTTAVSSYRAISTTKRFIRNKLPTALKKQSYTTIIYEQKINNKYEAAKKYSIQKLATNSKQFVFQTAHSITKSAEFIVKSITASPHAYLIYGLTALLLIIPIFAAACGSLASNNSIIPAQQILSEEVIAYDENIRKYAEENNIEEYIPVIKAIMMQESKGLGEDPMNASSFELNTLFPTGISDPDYSIQIGIKQFKQCLIKSNVQDINDEKALYLAIQGYNFELDYIEWAIEYFNGYSLSNVITYSDIKKDQLNVDNFGDIHYVDHVLRYIALGFGNLRSDPNFNNMEAWITKNPYAKANLYGQCTWFAVV